MKIETKLNLRDECYFLHKNKAVVGRVIYFNVYVSGPMDTLTHIYPTIKYTVEFKNVGEEPMRIELGEGNVFATKDELRASL